MTLKRSEMKRGTTALSTTKAMSRGTTPMARGTSMLSRAAPMQRGSSSMQRIGPIKAKAPSAGSQRIEITVFAHPELALLTTLESADAPVAKTVKARTRKLKTNRPKMTPIRASAKDEECTLRFPCCNYRIDTTVLCHRNGAGAGMKAQDTDAAYGCYACHIVLDGHAPRPEGFTRDMMLARFDVAVQLTHVRLAAKGLIAVGAAENAAQKNKSRSLLAAGIGFNSNQLIGQSMSKKIVPHINCVEGEAVRENVEFLTKIAPAGSQP